MKPFLSGMLDALEEHIDAINGIIEENASWAEELVQDVEGAGIL